MLGVAVDCWELLGFVSVSLVSFKIGSSLFKLVVRSLRVDSGAHKCSSFEGDDSSAFCARRVSFFSFEMLLSSLLVLDVCSLSGDMTSLLGVSSD